MPPIAFVTMILTVIAAAGGSIALAQVAGLSFGWLGVAALGVAVLLRGLAWK
jgi:hypothetical protein